MVGLTKSIHTVNHRAERMIPSVEHGDTVELDDWACSLKGVVVRDAL